MSRLCDRPTNFLLAAVIVATAMTPTAYAAETTWDLESFMKHVSENNAHIQAARLQKDAARLKAHPGDLAELSPFLQIEGGFLNDQKETTLPMQMGTQTVARQYSLGIAKKFTTGTTLAFRWNQSSVDLRGAAFVPPIWDSQYTFSVTQPLWKDFLGHAVRLRRERENHQARVAILTAEMQERQAVMSAEDAYWSMALQILDRQEKQEALNRAQKIRDWTARRLGNGIGDRADLLQVESLLAARRLSQITTGDSLENASRTFRDALGSKEISTSETPETLHVSTEALSKVRPLSSEATKENGSHPKRLDIWIQTYAAKIGEVSALEFKDATRPELLLQGNFGANARDNTFGTSLSEAWGTGTPFYQVGLKFAMSLDFGLKADLRNAADAEARAARLRADQFGNDEATSWTELVRRHRELGELIDAMEKLSRAQESQLAREQDRLAVGRTTTFQVVTFEQDVADSRLKLLQLRVQQRKLESASRLYLTENAVEAL